MRHMSDRKMLKAMYASCLTAFCARDYSNPHLPVTIAQLKRPGIGRNVSCAVGDFT